MVSPKVDPLVTGKKNIGEDEDSVVIALKVLIVLMTAGLMTSKLHY